MTDDVAAPCVAQGWQRRRAGRADGGAVRPAGDDRRAGGRTQQEPERGGTVQLAAVARGRGAAPAEERDLPETVRTTYANPIEISI
eukprot:7993341-Pyramimonas_sp.AAC.1